MRSQCLVVTYRSQISLPRKIAGEFFGQSIALREDLLATLPQCREVQLSDCRTSLPGTLLDSVLRLLSPLL